jgi:hypothetical protein
LKIKKKTTIAIHVLLIKGSIKAMLLIQHYPWSQMWHRINR